MDIMQTLWVAAVFALAGGVKGITGMGLPTVAMSLLGLWMPPAQAAALPEEKSSATVAGPAEDLADGSAAAGDNI